MKIKKKITKSIIRKLAQHAEHHTNKHIHEMVILILSGKTFNQAHKIAMTNVGN